MRSISALNQVLFALNKEYCLNEKKAVRMIDNYGIHPSDYKGKIDDIFATIGNYNKNACIKLRQLVSEVKKLLTVEQTEHVTATLDNLLDSKDMVL